VAWAQNAESAVVVLPLRAVSQALRNVVQNAIDASAADDRVELTAERTGDEWLLVVRDRGKGMDDRTRERAADPFFTTKQPVRGMGLGLFLTRSVLDFLGGSLQIQSSPGTGTRVTLKLPGFGPRMTPPRRRSPRASPMTSRDREPA
jgi:two-component system sensor histidine kinase RegB